MPEMHYVDSTNVEAIGYDGNKLELHVRFLSGSSYVYFDVPETVFEEFLRTSSKGGYLNDNIKGVYSFAKL